MFLSTFSMMFCSDHIPKNNPRVIHESKTNPTTTHDSTGPKPRGQI